MIQIKALTKKFGERTIFENFDYTIHEGEFVGITGSSGTGKSTLLNILGSLEGFDSGTIVIDKTDMTVVKKSKKKQLYFLAKKVSFLFQDYALMEDKTVAENILLTRIAKIDNQAEKYLEAVDMQGYSNRLVNTLSGGEQQRVAIARLFAKPSKIILADEPTGNLDKQNADRVWQSLKKLNLSGKTVVVVTHDVSALGIFNRVLDLDSLRIDRIRSKE